MRYQLVPVFAVLVIAIALAAGCTSAPLGSTASGTAQPATGTGSSALAQTQTAVLTNGTYAINATIDTITVDRTDDGSHQVNIYINAKNAGTAPVQLQWYSQLTAADGTTFGGVGISHDGDGAETNILGPGQAEEARDYVSIDTSREYAKLENGATLTVYFATEPIEKESPAEFTATWQLPASAFT